MNPSHLIHHWPRPTKASDRMPYSKIVFNCFELGKDKIFLRKINALYYFFKHRSEHFKTIFYYLSIILLLNRNQKLKNSLLLLVFWSLGIKQPFGVLLLVIKSECIQFLYLLTSSITWFNWGVRVSTFDIFIGKLESSLTFDTLSETNVIRILNALQNSSLPLMRLITSLVVGRLKFRFPSTFSVSDFATAKMLSVA